MAKRRTYRIRADKWTVLRDILVGTPEDFNGDSASLRGRIERSPMWGRLPAIDLAIMCGHRAAGAIDYVIYSYNTPIAYRITTANAQTGEHSSRWIVPDVRYSVTTSKHQGQVRSALSEITGGYDA